MDSCEFVTTISAIACIIAKNCSKEELPLIAASLTQLGDTLATMIVRDEFCKAKEEKDNKDEKVVNSL